MNKYRSMFFVAVVFMMFATVTSVFALNHPLQTEPPANPTIEYLLQLLFGLAVTLPGTTALSVMIINILKAVGWVKDEQAPVAQNIINVVFVLIIGALALFAPTFNIPGLDVTFGQIAGTLAALMPLLLLLLKWLGGYFHQALRGFPIIGFSYSLKKFGK